jgi:hypothetical protein
MGARSFSVEEILAISRRQIFALVTLGDASPQGRGIKPGENRRRVPREVTTMVMVG